MGRGLQICLKKVKQSGESVISKEMMLFFSYSSNTQTATYLISFGDNRQGEELCVEVVTNDAKKGCDGS